MYHHRPRYHHHLHCIGYRLVELSPTIAVVATLSLSPSPSSQRRWLGVRRRARSPSPARWRASGRSPPGVWPLPPGVLPVACPGPTQPAPGAWRAPVTISSMLEQIVAALFSLLGHSYFTCVLKAATGHDVPLVINSSPYN